MPIDPGNLGRNLRSLWMKHKRNTGTRHEFSTGALDLATRSALAAVPSVSANGDTEADEAGVSGGFRVAKSTPAGSRWLAHCHGLASGPIHSPSTTIATARVRRVAQKQMRGVKTELVLTHSEEAQLNSIIRSGSVPAALVQRARIVLACASGDTISAVARRLELPFITVQRLRSRFVQHRLTGLYETDQRGGRSRTVDYEYVGELIRNILKEKPKDGGRWTVRRLAAETGVSRFMLPRILHHFGIVLAKTDLVLTPSEEAQLNSIIRSRSDPAALVQRARIVLACASGETSRAVARRLDLADITVLKWRSRFVKQRLSGLYERVRPGRARSVDYEHVGELIRQILKEEPKDGGRRWTESRLAAETGIKTDLVHRILHRMGFGSLRRHIVELSTDASFIEKLRGVIGLYLNPPNNALVLCVDEKSETRALEGTTQPVLPVGLGDTEGVTHDDKRHGTTTLFAALDVLKGSVRTHYKARRRQQEFLAFLDSIETNVPAGLDVHLVVDNYDAHKRPTVKAWLARRSHWHIHFIYNYNSWLNQVERSFALITDKAIRRGSVNSVKDLIGKIDHFVAQYNTQCKPFAWTASAGSILAKLEAGDTPDEFLGEFPSVSDDLQDKQVRTAPAHKDRPRLHSCRTPEGLTVIRTMATRCSDEDIAASLNLLGSPTGQRNTWTAHRVRSLREEHGIHAYRSAEKYREGLTMSETATKLGCHQTIKSLESSKKAFLAAEQVIAGVSINEEPPLLVG
jgi:putative transposase